MTYQYTCFTCNETKTIEKPMAESSKKEYCEKCKSGLVRVFTSPTIKTGDGVSLS